MSEAGRGRSDGAPSSGDVRWEGTCRSPWGLPLSLVLLAVAGWNAVVGNAVLAVLLACVAYVGVLFSAIRVTVAPDAVRVRYRWAWTRRIPLADVEGAAVDQLEPRRWGGWGYRGGLRFFGRAAILLRGGEGIRLDLRGGRQLFIGIDDAAGAVAAIDELLAPPS